MRIMHTSDWHLGRTLEGINRLDEQREFIDQLVEVAADESIDLVLVAGDVFDTYNPSAVAEELYYDAVDRLSAKGQRGVVVIAGNHDNPDRLCAASPLAYKNGILLLGYPASHIDAGLVQRGNIKVIGSEPGWIELWVSGCDHRAVIITLPYPSEARLEQVLPSKDAETESQPTYSDRVGEIFNRLSQRYRRDTVNLGISHLFVSGGRVSESERTLQVGGALTVDPTVLPESAHFFALGHLHRPQQVKSARCPAYYSGSPLAYSFSEADYAKAVYVIDAVPDRAADIKELFLNCGKPLRRWLAKGGITEALEWCRQKRDINGWIDIEIHTDRVITAEEQKELRMLHPGIINIRPVITNESIEVQSYENREGRKIDQLFSDFYKYKTGTEISEDLMEVFLDVINQQQDDDVEAGGDAL
jgi:exonuclease SbcD